MKISFLMVSFVLATGNWAFGQLPKKEEWIGKRVFTQYGTVLNSGDGKLDDQGRSKSIAISGKDRNDSRVYEVKHVNGKWLWLKEEGGSTSGWVDFKLAIPCEKAIDFYTDKINKNPTASSYNDRGLAWSDKGEHDIAIADYNEAIRLDPSEAIYYNNRGVVKQAKGEFDKAISDYSEAIRLDPKHYKAYQSRANLKRILHKFDDAIADYTEAIRLDPQNSKAYYGRGQAWYSKKEYEIALADFRDAIRLDPKRSDPYNSRAWLWATCPDEKFRDGKGAIESATKACELSEWKDPNEIDTLAAAYAESGDFEKAVEFQERAVKSSPENDKEDFRSRLDLYKSGKPYREDLRESSNGPA